MSRRRRWSRSSPRPRTSRCRCDCAAPPRMRPAPRRPMRSASSGSPEPRTAYPRSCPVGCSSGSPPPARWPADPDCSQRTHRSARPGHRLHRAGRAARRGHRKRRCTRRRHPRRGTGRAAVRTDGAGRRPAAEPGGAVVRSVAWLTGLCRRRAVEVLGAAAGIAVAVAFVAALGAFITDSRAGLTARAAAAYRSLAGAGPARPSADIARTAAGEALLPAIDQTRAVGLVDRYPLHRRASSWRCRPATRPPRPPRPLPARRAGRSAAAAADRRQAWPRARSPGHGRLPGGGRRGVRADGVADLPQADSFFQVVGAPASAGATAPPDNVLLVPPDRFADLTRGASVVVQVQGCSTTPRCHPIRPPRRPCSPSRRITCRSRSPAGRWSGTTWVPRCQPPAKTPCTPSYRHSCSAFQLALAAVVTGLIAALRADRRRREAALLGCAARLPAARCRILAAETGLTAGLGHRGRRPARRPRHPPRPTGGRSRPPAGYSATPAQGSCSPP